MEQEGDEVPIFARAILIAHQRDALPYFDLRIDQFTVAGKATEAAFWSALKVEAQRQIASGEWSSTQSKD